MLVIRLLVTVNGTVKAVLKAVEAGVQSVNIPSQA